MARKAWVFQVIGHPAEWVGLTGGEVSSGRSLVSAPVAHLDSRGPTKYSLGTGVLPSSLPGHRNNPKGALGLCPRTKQ